MKNRKRSLQRLIEKAQKDGQASTPARLDTVIQVSMRPTTHQKAIKTMIERETLSDVKYRNAKVNINRKRTHPQILEFAKAFNKEAEKVSIPYLADTFMRSPARQNILKVQGVSPYWAGQSAHNMGCAVDMIHHTKQWDLTEKEHAVLAAIGYEVARKRGIKIVWGGDLTNPQPDHWELKHWRFLKTALKDLESNGWIPPDDDEQYFEKLETEINPRKKLRQLNYLLSVGRTPA